MRMKPAFAKIRTSGGIACLIFRLPSANSSDDWCWRRLVAAWAKGIKPDARRRWWSVARHRRLRWPSDLARLMDDMVTRRVDWSALDRTGARTARPILAAHAGFPEDRPRVLADHLAETYDRIEPAARRDRLDRCRSRAARARHDGPVIAAGSTGSMPSTAKLPARHRQPAARRGGAAGARYRSRRRRLAIASAASRDAKATSPRRPPRTIRNSRCTGCWTASASSAATSRFWARPREVAATCWYPRRCGRRTPPSNGTTG